MKIISYISGLVVSFLQIIFMIWPPKEITEWIVRHHSIIYLLIFLSILLGLFIGYFILKPQKSIKTFKGLKNYNKNLKRYSIVLVDDMFSNPSTLNDFKDKLDNYNIYILPMVNNVRSIIGFDVIILDIIGAGGILDSTKPLIKELYEIYPYKYIIALTSNPADLEDIKSACHIVPKPPKGKNFNNQLVSIIQKQLNEAFTLLDDPERYWEQIQNCIPEKEKYNIKKKFEHYILDSGLYSSSK